MGFFNEIADGFGQLGDIMEDGFEKIGSGIKYWVDEPHDDYYWREYERYGFKSDAQRQEYEEYQRQKAAREQEEEDRRLEPIREAERAQKRERFANMSEELEDLFVRFCAYNNGELDDAAKKQLLEDAAVFDGGCEAAIAHYSQKYDYDISQAGGSMELMKIMQHMDSIAKHYTKLKEEL